VKKEPEKMGRQRQSNKLFALTGMGNIMRAHRDLCQPIALGTNMGQVEQPFNFFLSSLSSDRDTAEKKLKDIRRRLVIMLDCRGCTCSEDLAHEAMLRFAHRLPNMDPPFAGDVIPYLYTVAYNLYLEYIEKQFLPLPDDFTEISQPDDDAVKAKEQLHKCLDTCLDGMDPKGRELVLDYYRLEKQSKIDFRKLLAQELGISVNALRIRLHNIREQCLGLKPPLETE
jgi:RNA polymerase sigma factor (sigma-70 family)